MKCLVTGATGFVGTELCGQLQGLGVEFIALSKRGRRLRDGTPTIAVDLTTTLPEQALLHDVDVVFHLAAIAHQHAAAEHYEQLNYRATLALAAAARQAGVRCFVFLSSVKAMAVPSLACAPTAMGRGTRAAPGTTAYAQSKWDAERELENQFKDSSMAIVVVRPALIYGSNPKGNLALLLRAARLGVPRPPPVGARSMVALSDLVAGLLQLVRRAEPGVATFVVTDGMSYSARDLYDAARVALGKRQGTSWLPLSLWRQGCRLWDWLLPGSEESTFDKIFGTELYDGSALPAATGWQPQRRMADVMAEMVAPATRPQD